LKQSRHGQPGHGKLGLLVDNRSMDSWDACGCDSYLSKAGVKWAVRREMLGGWKQSGMEWTVKRDIEREKGIEKTKNKEKRIKKNICKKTKQRNS
jgi:hypothetical protein